jgi:hypothetical protein
MAGATGVPLAAALGRQCRCRLVRERRHWRARAPASGTQSLPNSDRRSTSSCRVAAVRHIVGVRRKAERHAHRQGALVRDLCIFMFHWRIERLAAADKRKRDANADGTDPISGGCGLMRCPGNSEWQRPCAPLIEDSTLANGRHSCAIQLSETARSGATTCNWHARSPLFGHAVRR